MSEKKENKNKKVYQSPKLEELGSFSQITRQPQRQKGGRKGDGGGVPKTRL